MKLSILASVVFALISSSALASAPPAVRQARQAARIEQGVKSGELTKVETAKVVKTQAKIARSKRRAKADAVITPAEAARLEAQQNHASRQMRRLKHNGRTR